MEKEEVERCLQTLKFAESSARRLRVEPSYPETGRWLAIDDGYLKWESEGHSGLLLIRGNPGSGKSTLARRILNSIKLKYEFTSYSPDQTANKQRDILAADFSYSTSEKRNETGSHTLMLQSLLYQLLSRDERLFPLFRDAYRARESHEISWGYKDLKRIFESLASLEAGQKIYIFLDAMDESPGQGRSEILRLLLKLCSSSSGCTFKCLIATRPLSSGELGGRMNFYHVINMQDKNQGDIDRVIMAGLRDIQTNCPWFSPHFKSARQYITQHAQGVFLWVTLVLEQLASLLRAAPSRRDIDNCLKSLPLGLEGMYERIIRNLGGKACRILNWVAFAERSLETDEFIDAIAIPLSTEPFKPDPKFLEGNRVTRLEHNIRFHCGQLVRIRQPATQLDQSASRLVVQLLHPTVWEFLMRSRPASPIHMDEKGGNEEIVTSCIRYIELLPAAIPTGTKRLQDWGPDDYTKFVLWLADFRLLEYIATCLPKHMKSLSGKAKVDQEMRFSQALGENKVMYCLFEDCVQKIGSIQIEARCTRAFARQFRLRCLVAAAQEHCTKAINPLVALGTDVNGTEEKSGDSALPIATGKEHLDAEKVLPALPTKLWDRIRQAPKRMSMRLSQSMSDKRGVYVHEKT
ncbi:hypothetical protein F4820DRAFT_399609 [Hypoxylon rubiginosum]|uniref:Uncharacterized protein n=1 Tax=Hypoxylon rubiginosum TaxID=110542 RepID=A0ACB9YTI3_9PEZI|nr:hypothetical protein F4820DRAFT_399609 [Hypoxylon rubiginosum]